jgi:Protein of unknown function (DUF4235)
MAQGGTNPMLAEVLVAVGGISAAILARKVVNVVWVAASGKQAPEDPADPRVSTREAIAFSVATAAAVGVGRLLVLRKANELKARRRAKAGG